MTREIIEPIIIEAPSPIDEARKIAAALNGRVIRLSETQAVRFRVVEEPVDLGALRLERTAMLAQAGEPTQAELLAWAKERFPRELQAAAVARIAEIDRTIDEAG